MRDGKDVISHSMLIRYRVRVTASELPAGTVVVTGASRGIGQSAARELAADSDRHIVLAVRGDADAHARELAARTGNPHIHPLTCDLGSLTSVRTAAAQLAALLGTGDLPPLRALIANAGVQLHGTARTTADGYELTFGTNVIGHYALIRALLPRLSAPGRVVLVTSSTHFGDFRHTYGSMPAPRWREVDSLARPRAGTRRDGQAAYTTSKLALIYLAHVLARHVPQGVDVYSFNPGLVLQTSIIREYGPAARAAARLLATPLQHTPLTVSLRESGCRLAEAATGRVAAPSGSYLDLGRPARSSPESYDERRENDLWAWLEALPGQELHAGEAQNLTESTE